MILTNPKSFFKNSYILEAGISDHGNLITTTLRSQLVKRNAKMKMYRDYIIFNIDSFSKNLEECLKKHAIYDYSYFQNAFVKLLKNMRR